MLIGYMDTSPVFLLQMNSSVTGGAGEFKISFCRLRSHGAFGLLTMMNHFPSKRIIRISFLLATGFTFTLGPYSRDPVDLGNDPYRGQPRALTLSLSIDHSLPASYDYTVLCRENSLSLAATPIHNQGS